MQVTNLALSVKDSPTSTLAWVTTLDTATPVPDARVVIRNMRNDVLWTGTTGRDGIAMAPPLPLRSTQRPWEVSFIVTAEKGTDVTWVASNWTTSGTPGIRSSAPGDPALLRGSVFTDRGVYALGDEVRLKAVLREDTSSGVSPVAQGVVLNAIVWNGQQQEVVRTTLAVSEWSSAEWQWRIPTTGGLGTYTIEVTDPTAPNRGSARASFLVAAFRRPDFSVEVAVNARTPVQGATIEGRIAAQFLFGAALGPQPVRWSLRKQPVREVPAAIRARFPEDRFAFGYDYRHNPRAPWDSAVTTEATTLPASGPLQVTHTTTACLLYTSPSPRD